MVTVPMQQPPNYDRFNKKDREKIDEEIYRSQLRCKWGLRPDQDWVSKGKEYHAEEEK